MSYILKFCQIIPKQQFHPSPQLAWQPIPSFMTCGSSISFSDDISPKLKKIKTYKIKIIPEVMETTLVK